MSKVRQERTAEQIQQLLSELFLRQVSDPRLAGVTITEVEIDRELQYATAFVNALGDETREEEVMAGLQSAAGFLRRELAGSLGLRAAPIIRFQWDPRLRYVEEVDKLLEELDIKPDDTPAAVATGDTATPPPSADVVELDELDDVEADEGNENDPEQL
jgi:ribosome-binding factor A